jgi:hypothetical protein
MHFIMNIYDQSHYNLWLIKHDLTLFHFFTLFVLPTFAKDFEMFRYQNINLIYYL